MARILVVDDSAEDRYLVSLVVSSRGHEVTEAESAPEALELIRAELPDLVVTDLLMPGMDGYEFVDTLRSDEALASARVLFLSALYDESELADLELAFAGCRFLAKPADPEQLLAAVEDALAAAPPPTPSPAVDLQSLDRLRVLTARLARAMEEEAARTAELDRRLRQQESIAGLGFAALGTLRIEDTYARAAESVAAALDVELVAIFELVPEAGELILRSGFGWDEEAVGLATLPAPAAASTEAAVFDDVRAPLLRAHHVVGGVQAPIRGASTPFGVLAAFTTGTRVFDRHDVNFLEAVANVVGAAVERSRSEEELARLAAIVDSSNDAIVGSRFDGTVVSWNAAAERIYGYSAAEMIGRPLRTIVPSDQIDRIRRLHGRVAAGKAIDHFQTVQRRKDGRLIDVDLTLSPVRDATGAVVAMSAISRDVTEQRRAAEERLRLAGLVEAANDFIGIASLAGEVQYLNAAGRALLGLGRADVGYIRIGHYFDAETAAEVERVGIPTAIREGLWRGDAVLRHFETGAEIEVETTLFLLRDQDGAPSALAIVQRDVSEQRQLEAQLRQSQKMEAVGRLAGGLAHDFNNLLTIVIGYSELLLAEEREPQPEVEQILYAARQGSLLTGKLLAFSRQQVLRPRVLDVNEVVTGIEQMLQRAIGTGNELSVRLDSEIGRVRADPGQLEQVILNLAVNAGDAMPEGGLISVRTSTLVLDETTA